MDDGHLTFILLVAPGPPGGGPGESPASTTMGEGNGLRWFRIEPVPLSTKEHL